MTVSTDSNRIQHTGNGIVSSFAYDFVVLDQNHMKVYFNDTLQNSGYTVTGVGNQGGGTVDFSAPVTDGVTITLVRVVPLVQLTDYTDYTKFPAQSHERALDFLTFISQQIEEESLRSLRIPISDLPGSDLIIPGKVSRSGAVLAFDEVTGDPIPGPNIASVGTVADNMENINTVAGNTANINTVAENIPAIFTAEDNAANSAISAANSASSAAADAIATAADRVQTGLDVEAVGSAVSAHNSDDDAHGMTAVGRALLRAADAAAGRTAIGLGTAAVANLTTSATDTTAGRVLRVGDGGVNGVGIGVTAPADLNDITANGIYIYGSRTNQPVATSANILVHKNYDATRAEQTVYTITERVFTRMRIDSVTWGAWRELYHTGNLPDGGLIARQPAPAAVNATATLTADNLQTRIITSTTAAAVTATLPTGTLMDGLYSALTNMAFDWSVINTGGNNFTVSAGTGHTVVGGMVVVGGSSGMFRSRRTGANTWVTYRVS